MSNELQMKLLACSTCGGELEVFGSNYRCKNCNNVYEITENISEEADKETEKTEETEKEAENSEEKETEEEKSGEDN